MNNKPYGNRGIDKNDPRRKRYIVVEYSEDGFAVNEYYGYDSGKTTFTLYPNRRLIPSTKELRAKHTISIFDMRREF